MTQARASASAFISSEELAACKPWELNNFGATTRAMTDAECAALKLPTIDQISAIQEQARLEGYQAGLAEGRAAGLEQAVLEAARIARLADAFSTEVARADEAIAQQVLDLALDLARAMLHSTLAAQPERVIPVVREAVRYLPVVQQPALLFLNPDDALLVRERIGDELEKMGWQISDDALLDRGGCRVETASNQIDSTLPTRWQRLLAALGKPSDWLAA
jgi:flagellar assembly protein FliH